MIKILLTLDVNPETNEVKIVKCTPQDAVVKSKKKSASEMKNVDNTTSAPQITLEDNKYYLNEAAAEFMGVEWEDRLDIKYQNIDKVLFPIIGTSESFGTKSGNKLTKSLSVAFRGKANERLATFGKIFDVTKYIGNDNLFVLVGNGVEESSPEVVDETIQVTESEEIHVDLDDKLELEDDSEIDMKQVDFTL